MLCYVILLINRELALLVSLYSLVLYTVQVNACPGEGISVKFS